MGRSVESPAPSHSVFDRSGTDPNPGPDPGPSGSGIGRKEDDTDPTHG